MRHKFAFVVSVGSLVGLLSSPASATPILQVNGSGLLTGALNVDVGGTLYDVAFVDTSCADAYDGCTDPTDFTFQTASAATLAAQALRDQVFLDGPSGNFDTNPASTFGCTTPGGCFVWTPYAFDGHHALTMVFINDPSVNLDSVGSLSILPGTSQSDFAASTFARWTPAETTTPVPEPASMLLLGTGLAGLAARRYRRART